MTSLDMMIIIIYFAVLVIVGIIGTIKAKTSEVYILAGRNLGVFMLFGCLTAVFLGGSSTIGSAQLGYETGFSGVWFVFSMGLGITLFGLLLLKRVTGYRLMTISELLGKLFNVESKLIGAVVAAIYALMVSVTQVIAIGALLSAIFDWNLIFAMLIGGGIVFFYTILGGMWSVSMTDIIQFVIMTAGIFLIMLPISLSKAGGFSELTAQLPSSYFSFSAIGFREIMQYLLTFTLGMMVGQDIWQRYFTAKNLKTARTGGVLVGIYSFLYSMAMVIIGMCALIILPNIENTQNVFTSMAFETLPTGLLGVVFAAVAAAIMSTASGTLLASSTLIAKDILKDHYFKNITDKQFLLLSRITTFVIGIIAIVIALWIQELLVAIDVAYALLAGSVFIPIVFGLFWKRATSKAAFYAMIISAVVILGGLAMEGLSSSNPILYGIVTNIIVMVAVSLTDSQNKDKVTDAKEANG
ncbi:sodium:solute symporter [Virgibacillus alimentarius]|uniref:SSS family solute:Na+ symporter n=1 Tax=Virgibacillus alimentarius TaxID=698769 RepID=A0ABS4SCK5_9BACI|nr:MULTISPECIES: sodium:solute symporter [Virgibacillus]MBP2258142.1 SSS family solute:Na+ symporter [Virgibacillus alimentarius]HLR69113.1 sodium:solute symporter [Virgibacillus sp.]